MDWFLLAIVARFLWAGCNITDHYVANHFKGKSAFSNVIFFKIMTIPILLVLLLVVGVPTLPPLPMLAMIGLGALFAIAGCWPYIQALRKDEPHNIAPLFELTPVFVMVLALPLLGEQMGVAKAFFGFVCVACGFLFLWDFENGRLKTITFLLMLASSFFYACFQLMTRWIGPSIPAYDLTMFVFLGVIVGTTAIGLCVPNAYKDAFQGLRSSNFKVLASGFGTEILSVVANFSLIAAYTTAPTAGQVAALSGTQPVFAFIIAHAVSFMAPGHYQKLVWNRDLQIKLVLLAILIASTVALRLL